MHAQIGRQLEHLLHRLRLHPACVFQPRRLGAGPGADHDSPIQRQQIRKVISPLLSSGRPIQATMMR